MRVSFALWKAQPQSALAKRTLTGDLASESFLITLLVTLRRRCSFIPIAFAIQ